MSVVDVLKSIGGGDACAHKAFNQGAFMGPHTRVGGVSIANGFCSGVVLDWARRVLQSAEDRDSAYLNFKNKRRNLGTLGRMVNAYRGHASTYVAESVRTSALAALRRMHAKPEVNSDQFGRGVAVSNDEAVLFSKLWRVPDATGPFRRFDLSYETAGTLSHDYIQHLLDALATREEDQHTPRNANGRVWQQFAAELDEMFTAQRRHHGKAPRKLYSNMRVERSSTMKDYDDGGQLNYALMNGGFELHGCTIVAFGPTGGGTGHAVATYQKSDSQYLFFDPNFGVFTYTKPQLKNCFQHLFWAPWKREGAGVLDDDKAVYARRDNANEPPSAPWNRMGYTVFMA